MHPIEKRRQGDPEYRGHGGIAGLARYLKVTPATAHHLCSGRMVPSEKLWTKLLKLWPDLAEELELVMVYAGKLPTWAKPLIKEHPEEVLGFFRGLDEREK